MVCKSYVLQALSAFLVPNCPSHLPLEGFGEKVPSCVAVDSPGLLKSQRFASLYLAYLRKEHHPGGFLSLLFFFFSLWRNFSCRFTGETLGRMHTRWDFPRAMRVGYEGLHAQSQPGFPLQHNSTSELSSRSWSWGSMLKGSVHDCQNQLLQQSYPCCLCMKAFGTWFQTFFFTVAGRLLSVTKTWLRVVNFSAMLPWDSQSTFLLLLCQH